MVIKGDGYERLYIGKLVSDPKVSTFGEKQYTKTRFGVRYKDGDNGIINVDTKFELADRCKELRKFDGVIVVGKLDNYESKDGSKKWFLDAELVTADMSVIERAAQKSGFSPASGGFPVADNGFAELEEDELPFD